MSLIFIAGGARSGKSRTALGMAVGRGTQPLFISTSLSFEEDIQEFIEANVLGKGLSVNTHTEPLELAAVIRKESASRDVLLVDSLTVWLGNVLEQDAEALPARLDDLLETLRQCPITIIAVATEVGCGVEPESELGRRFRDEAGRLNQRCAAMADETYWMVFGCPLRVK